MTLHCAHAVLYLVKPAHLLGSRIVRADGASAFHLAVLQDKISTSETVLAVALCSTTLCLLAAEP